MKGKLDPYRAIDRQRRPHSYVEHLEERGRTLFGRLVRLGLRRVRLAVDVYEDTTLEPYTHAMLTRRALNAVRLGLASAGAAARWMAAIERLAASGQFAFTLNYYATRGVKPDQAHVRGNSPSFCRLPSLYTGR